jgi:opacity protein-like surface antigen
MRKLTFTAAYLLLGAAAAQAADATAASAERFLRGLYAQYTANGKPTPFLYPDARNIADPAMMALLKRDRDKANGEVGAMDSDPICRCQDWESIKVKSVQVTMLGENAATADVTMSDMGDTQKIHYSLVWTKDGWRIHDISTKDQPSLVAYLRTYKY